MNICRTERKVSCMAYVTRKIISSYANDSILLLWRSEHLTSIYPWTNSCLINSRFEAFACATSYSRAELRQLSQPAYSVGLSPSRDATKNLISKATTNDCAPGTTVHRSPNKMFRYRWLKALPKTHSRRRLRIVVHRRRCWVAQHVVPLSAFSHQHCFAAVSFPYLRTCAMCRWGGQGAVNHSHTQSPTTVCMPMRMRMLHPQSIHMQTGVSSVCVRQGAANGIRAGCLWCFDNFEDWLWLLLPTNDGANKIHS